MTAFFFPPYLKPYNSKNVISSDKAPDVEIEDSKNGISRFGGRWRQPSYLMAYLRSTEILIDHGIKHNTLDDIGLPVFYMQRHALELLIKQLVEGVCEIAELQLKLHSQPKREEKHLTIHDLKELFNYLCSTSNDIGFTEPPIELEKLVDEIVGFETHHTFARYANHKTVSKINNERIINNVNHVENETALPIVDIQEHLKLVVSKAIYDAESFEEPYENEIYNKWNSLMHAIDHYK